MIRTESFHQASFLWEGEHGFTKIVGDTKNLSLGRNVIIDDFVFIVIGQKTHIGDYVHITSFSSLTGGGELEIRDFVGISGGCRILTGTEILDGTTLTNPTIPEEFRKVHRAKVLMDKHSFVGANSVIMPGVWLGEGAVVGANSFVQQDRYVPPWEIWAGSPAKLIGYRMNKDILKLEDELCWNWKTS